LPSAYDLRGASACASMTARLCVDHKHRRTGQAASPQDLTPRTAPNAKTKEGKTERIDRTKLTAEQRV
jgi:hypothetical protein